MSNESFCHKCDTKLNLPDIHSSYHMEKLHSEPSIVWDFHAGFLSIANGQACRYARFADEIEHSN